MKMELTEPDLEGIWTNDIRDHIFRNAVAVESPVLICVGAQPGAGKTQVGKAAEGLYPEVRSLCQCSRCRPSRQVGTEGSP